MCDIIVLMSSLLFNNVENILNKEKPLNEYVSKHFPGTVYEEKAEVYLSIDVNISPN
jgi:hypothetical protein